MDTTYRKAVCFKSFFLCLSLLLLLSGCEDGITRSNAQTWQTAASSDAQDENALLNINIDEYHNNGSMPDSEYAQINWDNLRLPGHGLKEIVEKYQLRIDLIPEGNPAEDAVMEKMRAELNATPVNPEMNNKKIKLPGFIAPLDMDEKAMISEFLLVPYFGACIHLPPPPLSQTVLVKPLPGKSIGMERAYEPVLVSGMIKTEKTETDLAYAGYQILDAAVEIYRAPE